MNEEELLMEVSFDELPAFYKIMVNLVGQENTFKLAKEFGGEKVYFPALDCCITPARNRRIYQEYKGANIGLIAKKYSLTTQQIRHLRKQEKAKRG